MGRLDRPHERATAMAAPQNRSHRRRIQTQGAYGFGRAARVALNLRGRYLEDEDLLEKTCGSVTIQNEMRVIRRHGAHPEGPKRSVLIVKG